MKEKNPGMSAWWNRLKSESGGKKLPRKDQLLIGLLLGILLIVIAVPVSREEEAPEETAEAAEEKSGKMPASGAEREAEARLEEVLLEMEGVGRVRVMITWKDTGERIVEKDTPREVQKVEEHDSSGGGRLTEQENTREETVYEEDENGRKIPYVIRENQPRPEGVLVIAEGGDDPVTAQNIMEAVQALFAVEAHKIKIMKMEGAN